MYIVLLSPEFVTSRGLSQFRIRKQSNLIVSDIYSTDSRACTGLNSASYHVEVTIILIAGFVPVRDQRAEMLECIPTVKRFLQPWSSII